MKNSFWGKYTLIPAVLTVVMAMSCIVVTPSYAKSKKKKPVASELVNKPVVRNVPQEVSSRYRYFFHGAIAEKIAERYESALVLLMHCAEIDSMAAETYFYMADCYEHLGNDSMQVSMLRKAAEMRPDNATYKESLIPIYLQEGKLDDATSMMEELLKHNPERTDMLNILLQIYNYKDQNAKCLDVLNRMEVQDGKKEETTMAKVQILTRMNRLNDAYEEMKELCDTHPLDLTYRVMFGNWLMGHGESKEALQQYRQVLKEEPDNEEAMLSLYDYYRKENLEQQADSQRDKLLLNANTHDENRVTMIKMWVRDSEAASVPTEKMLHDFDKYIDMAPNKQDLMLLKASYMDLKKVSQDSIDAVYKQILELYPDNAESRYHLIQTAWSQNNSKAMIEFCKPALQYNPDNWSFYYFLAVGQTLEGQHEECVNTINQARGIISAENENDKKLASDMFEMLGDSYYSLGKLDEAWEAYDECLKYNPDNLGCLNNYAYYLSEVDKDLDKAAEMSFRTIKAQPSNATFLDSYAWILYKLGRYEEAAIYIDMALQFLDPEADNTTYVKHSEQIKAKIKQ